MNQSMVETKEVRASLIQVEESKVAINDISYDIQGSEVHSQHFSVPQGTDHR